MQILFTIPILYAVFFMNQLKNIKSNFFVLGLTHLKKSSSCYKNVTAQVVLSSEDFT